MKFLNLLLEEDNKLVVLRKSISERLPITIQYSGPPGEVKSGSRIDIMPVVLGTNAKSGNKVIWAYVMKGVSKKGLPNWKMFRLDRIVSAKFNLGVPSFTLSSIPGYQKGKTPSMMRSLSSVDIFSPYWMEDKKYKKNAEQPKIITPPEEKPIKQTEPKIVSPPEEVANEPESSIPIDVVNKNYTEEAFNNIQSKIKDIDGRKIISKLDYGFAVDNIYRKKEDDWKNYKSQMSGNVRPGEGTRNKFRNEANNEFTNLLKNNNIEIEDMLSEIYNKFLHLIK